MIKQRKSACWKKRIFYLTPFILGCFIQVASASGIQDHEQQLAFSIEKPNVDTIDEGHRLYQEALQRLEKIAKQQKAKKPASKSNYVSYTDRLVEKVIEFWNDKQDSNSIIPTTSYKQEFSAVRNLLETSATEYQNNDALLLLAELSLFSKYSYPRDYQLAFDYYQELASRGNATAQHMLGFMYATGIKEKDQAKALLYHTFAAHGGDTAAQMTMGYRSLFGIGTEESCEDALFHYKQVAAEVVDYYLSGPPGGIRPPLSKVRLSEEEGGVFGFSATGSKMDQSGSERSASMDEILQYWRYLASKNDVDAQLMLGQVYYLGIRNVPHDYKEALHFFYQIVSKTPPSGKASKKFSKALGQAAGYLGLMHWRGEGVSVDEQSAFKFFEVGAHLGDPHAQNYLGMMYLNGVAVEQDREKALGYFAKAADQDNANAQVNLAIEFMNNDAKRHLAIRWFTKAAESKHLLAYWYLAQMNENNLTPTPSCRIAVSYYKAIAERGDWLNPIVEEAYEAFRNNEKENALLYYMLAAERGYEVAQSNIAYLLDEDKHMLDYFPSIRHYFNTTDPVSIQGLDRKETAFMYWTRAANQNNIDARVKMGDYYYKGIGTEVNFEKAVSCYRLAAEVHASPLAYWNLGWMYENGIGVAKDFHLAKRAYDQALNIDPHAYLPVQLSLLKMYIKYYWGWLTGQEAPTVFDDPKETIKKNTKTLQDKSQDKVDDIGEEMKRQYKMKKQKEREEQERLNSDDILFNNDDEYSEGNEFVESLLILISCFLVGYLVYVRQFRFRQPDPAPNMVIAHQRNNNP